MLGIGVSQELYDRAKKKVGLSDERISSFTDAESLKQFLDGIHPNSNPDARVTQGKPPEPAKFEENMPDSFTLESILEAKFISTNRDHFDNKNLQDFLLRINRRYGTQHPVRILMDRSFVVKNRELLTKYTIFYK